MKQGEQEVLHPRDRVGQTSGATQRCRILESARALGIRDAQARARTLSERPGGPTPVAPDLWLLVNGEHRFIEVKLPGDRLRSSQRAGLELVAAHLPSALPIAVSVVELVSSEDQFANFTRILRR